MLSFKNIFLFFLFLVLISCSRNEITELSDDGLPPAAPVNLVVYAAFDGQVGLSWQPNNEPDIYGYSIFRSKNDTLHFVFIQLTTNNYFIDVNLDYDSIYYYKINAVDKFHRESKFSQVVSAQPKNIYKPLRPQYVKIHARNIDDEKYILLNWSPSIDNDIHYYEIYRDTGNTVNIIPSNLIDTSSNNYYIDKKELKLLKKYSYSIIAVDKGGLKSEPSYSVSDIILNKPVLIFPLNNSVVNFTGEFKFRAVSMAADYKLVIQRNPVYGIIYEYDFSSDKTDTLITINLPNIYLEPYNTYYWRILTFTQKDEPNSSSETFSFTFIPK